MGTATSDCRGVVANALEDEALFPSILGSNPAGCAVLHSLRPPAENLIRSIGVHRLWPMKCARPRTGTSEIVRPDEILLVLPFSFANTNRKTILDVIINPEYRGR